MEEKKGKCYCGNECKDEKLEAIIDKYTNDKDNLIQLLNEVQENYGYVPSHAQQRIAEYLNISLAEVHGVVTFYSRFTLKPKGKYNISVCLGTACFVKGSENVLNKVKELLNLEEGETTPDGLFSLDSTRCIGACGLAPVFTVNDEVYGKATPKMVEEVINEYRNKK